MATKQPLLRPAIALCLGIVFAGFSPVDWRFGFSGAAGFLAFSLWRTHDLLRLGFWLFLGASLLSFRFEPRREDDLRRILSGEPELVTVRGALSADPERRVLEQDQRTRYRTTARLKVAEIERREGMQAASGEIAISTTGFVPDYFIAGARVEISGVIAPPQGPIAPGLFDFDRYLKWQRMFFALRAESTNDWKLIRQPEGWSPAALYRQFNVWARATLQRGIPEDENTRLLWAMALGWKPGLTNEISEPFVRTGTLHVYAISGLHIAMIAGMLVSSLRRIGLQRKWAGLIAIPLIWFYTAATGWQASAIRSTIMSSVVIFGWLLKRPNNLLNSLSVAAILILLWQPEQLFQPGFQLSFILLLGLAIWPGLSPNSPWPDPALYLGQADPAEFSPNPRVNAWTRGMAKVFEKLTGRDAMLPADLRPKWRRRLDPWIAGLLGGANISLASLVGSLPVTAYYFNLISFSSVVANLFIVPASGVALGASLLSLVLAPLPYLSEAANWVGWITMEIMVQFCRALERFHWTYEYVQAPGPLLIASYFLVVLAVLNRWIGWRLMACGILAVAVGLRARTEAITTSVTLLPGSGVIFVDAPGAKNDLLIECGRDREAATIVKPFLRSRGVDRLKTIVLRHGDVSHIEGYSRLAEEFRVEVTGASAARSRSPKYREILRALETTPDKWRKLAAGDEIAGWRALHPAAGEDFSRADDEAIVLRKALSGTTVMLLSDLGRLGQQKLADSGQPLRSEVIFCGAPTGDPPLRPQLAEAVQPALVLFAGNDANAQKAARDLRSRGLKVLDTAQERAITLRAQRGVVFVETLRGTHVKVSSSVAP